MKVTAIYDIGKTNKKLFLFDKNYKVVYKEFKCLNETKDEDGFPTDDLAGITKWIKKSFAKILKTKKYDIQALNFSTYGASFVHIDKNGQPLTPLYNYLKPYPKKIVQSFYNKYGSELKIAKETASPPSGMLNSGLQLYWLKYTQPGIYNKTKWSLHFPQYLSFLFTGIPVSEYTSIGCHTSLWDYKKKCYHDWVYTEGIDKILPPIAHTNKTTLVDFNGKKIKIGMGIHDSSAALLPYIRADKKPFLLISTGTWSISLNPFNHKTLTKKYLKNDCLNYMRIDGKPVKAARLFLGNEHQLQVEKLSGYFNKKNNYYKKVRFDKSIYLKLKKNFINRFHFESIPQNEKYRNENNYSGLKNFKEAYHQLMIELMELQVNSAKLPIGNSKIKTIYIDGGFADNDIFIKLLSFYFKNYKLRTTQSPLGSALGAAMVISNKAIGKQFLKKNYSLKKIKLLFLSK